MATFKLNVVTKVRPLLVNLFYIFFQNQSKLLSILFLFFTFASISSIHKYESSETSINAQSSTIHHIRVVDNSIVSADNVKRANTCVTISIVNAANGIATI